MKKNTKWALAIVAGVIVTVFALCIGIGAASMDAAKSPPPAGTTSAAGREVTSPEAIASASASPAAAKPTEIQAGTWTVNVDIPAGTYRSSGAKAGCYWAIMKTGSNGADIVANDLPSGGRPQITLKKGQDFQTSDECGVWTKIK
jgi:hypothetical protein